MKKNYFIIIMFAILFSGVAIAQETQKNFINYQGVARNADNALMVSEQMTINIALRFGAANAASVYEESHTLMTDANGVFSLLIGIGNALSGDYNSLPWGSAATFVTVSMNGNELGTTEMMAVPYAISSGDADNQSAAEVAYNNATSGLTATTTQDAIDELSTGGTVDADADPTNEIQTLNFDVGTNELSLSDGNSVVIPTGGVDGDGDSTNEIQTISFDAGTNELSLSDGGVVTIPSGGTDADADPENEIQNLSLSGTTLNISDGTGVDLTPIIPTGGSDNQNLTFNGATNVLEIEDGNTVDLSSLAGGSGSSLWSQNGSDINYIGGRVGIGTGTEVPDAVLEVAGFSNSEGILTVRDTEGGGFTNLAINSYGVQGRSSGANSSLSLNRSGGAILMGGDVRIGQEGAAIPPAKLDVNGGIQSKDLSGTGERNVMADADGNLIIGAGGGGSSLWTENGGDINYTSGNVGIGKEDPTAKMHVLHESNIASPQLRLEDSEADYARLEFKNAATGYWHIAGRGGDTGDVSRLNFYHHNGTTGQDYMTIAGSGNVGIGTTSPSSKLEVAGDIKTSGEVHSSTTGSANMIPIAYGEIHVSRGADSGSGNFTLNKIGTGEYEITISGEGFNPRWTVLTTRKGPYPGFISITTHASIPKFNVHTFDRSGSPGDVSFSFAVFSE